MLTRLPAWWGRLLIASLLLLTVPSCGSKDPLRIGFVANMTGPNAALGVDGRDGALLAVDKINASGGVTGRPLELVIRDDLGTAEGAITADTELIKEEKLSIVIGHMTSNTMMAAWSEFKDSGVLFLSPTVSTPQLSGMHDNFFRLIPVNSIFSAKLAEHAANELSLKRVAIFYDTDNDAFTNTFRQGFEKEFVSNGGEILLEYAFSSASAPDFKGVLAALESNQPDSILIIASAVDTALITQQARLEGLNVQFLTSNWALTQDLMQNGGRTVDGIITVVAHDENDQTPEHANFANRFEERYGRSPTFAAGYGYESVLVMANALQATGGEQNGLADALLSIHDLTGVNGSISFDPYGDVLRTLYLISVRDGQFVTEATFAVP